MNENQRIIWIDWAKVVGITLVVWGHIPDCYGKATIFLFHMPLFYMISGYLYKYRNLRDEIHRIWKSLILPYFIYNVFLLILTPPENLEYGVLNFVLGNQEQLPNNFRPMWFVVSIVVMRLIASAFYDSKQKIALGMFVLFIIMKLLEMVPLNFDIFQINTTLLSFHFFCFGDYIRKKSCSIKIYYILITVIVFVVIGLYNSRDCQVNLFRCLTGVNIFLFVTTAYALCLSIIITLQRYANTVELPIIKTLSKGTLLILCLHQTFIDLCEELIHTTYVPRNIIVLCLVMLFMYALIRFCERWCPLLIGKSRK